MTPAIKSRITLGLLSTTLFSLLLLGGLFLIFTRTYTKNLGSSYLEQKALELVTEFHEQRDNSNDPTLSPRDNQILRRILIEEQAISLLQFRILDANGRVTDNLTPERGMAHRMMPLQEFLFDQLGPAIRRARNNPVIPPGRPTLMENGTRLTVPLSPMPGSPVLEISTEPDFMNQLLKDALIGFSGAAALSLLIAGLIGYLIAQSIANPLVQLSKKVESFSISTELKEDETVSFSLKKPGSREIEQLSHQFSNMSKRLAESYSSLQEERDSLRMFLADASHELRSPLTSGIAFTELLQGPQGIDPGYRQEYLSDLSNQLFRMKSIVENLLNLSRIDAGMNTWEPKSFDLSHFLKSLRREFLLSHSNYQERDFRLHIPELPNLDPWSDPEILERIFSAILDNAHNYGSPPIEIRITLEPETNSEQQTLFMDIIDHGTGIQPEELPNLTKRFYRGHAGNTSRQGLGLGLSISDSLTRALGGTLILNPDRNNSLSGLTVRLVFPVYTRPNAKGDI